MSFKRYSDYRARTNRYLPSVPSHWGATRFKLFAEEREERSTDGNELLLSVSEYSGVSPRSTIVDEGDHLSRAESLEGYKVCHPGDLVMNIMLAWKKAQGVSTYHGIVSPAYSVYALRGKANARFIHYLTRTQIYADYFKCFSSGVIDSRLRLYPDTFLGLKTDLPPEEEQSSVANFLDRETAKIDALIAEQQRLIELLQEKRQVVISGAVTKGLNPNAPMKDSGVEWLGEVPEHWVVRRLGHIGTLQNGLNISGEAFGEGDPFISYGDVYKNPNVPQKPVGLVRSTPEDKQKYGLEKGDVLFTRTSETVDDIGVASTCLEQIPHSTFAGFLIRLRPFKGVLEPRYSTHLFRNQGVKTHFAGTMNMVTRASLSQGELGNLAICLPPLDEQLKIASAIEEMAGQSDQLISSAWELVALLQERRSALISAAVTGQIDVRGLATEEEP